LNFFLRSKENIPYFNSMKKRLLNFFRAFYLESFFKGIYKDAKDFRRKLSGIDKKIKREYLAETEVKKLHIGCGKILIENWLNADFDPKSKEVLNFDATTQHPFKSNIFDYIFSEHMIEHVTYPKGESMLFECFRILKPNGKIRISTPDLSFLIDLYRKEKSEIQMDFLKHSTDKWIPYATENLDTFVINNYVRAWGHSFIYDEKVLKSLFEKVGFVNISRFKVKESEDIQFQNLENVNRKPDGFISLESLVLEATKP
jgi:predicted SAM-dependent methyltransferase